MKISFVIPSFNNAAFLPFAVKSVQDQTIKDWELVIVDDCSTDSTSQYIKWLLGQGDKRIVYHRNEVNLGRSESRNIGNRLAACDIIAVLDADDMAITKRAEWTIKKMKNCQVCYGSALAVDVLGNALHEIPAAAVDFATCVKQKVNRIVHSTLAYTKEIASKYPYEGGKISDLGLDDWFLELSMLSDGVKFDFIPDVIAAYRIHGGGVMQTRDNAAVLLLKNEILEGLKCKV